MGSLLVDLAENVEKERLYIEVQCLVVEKQFGQEAEVLAIELVVATVSLKDGEGPFSVNLFTRWLTCETLTGVVSESRS